MTFLKPDSYKRIAGYARAYQDKLEILAKGSGLAAPNAGDDVFAVLMDKGDVARLLLHPDCNKLAAIIGIADDGTGDTMTVSLLAVGRDGKVLPQHRKAVDDPNGELQLAGEEVWPTKIKMKDLSEFLP